MDREENKILKQFGRMNRFKVPEGYFDHLSEEILSNLPDESVKSVAMKPIARPSYRWLKVAMLVGVVSASSLLGLRYMSTDSPDDFGAGAYSHNAAYSIIDEIADYTMMDNEEIYASLIDNN
ncbi:hypothetical protein JHU38_03015 [Prevotella sp. A2931]|uniref:Uncharacterized protein n=2 Tax=Prevotellaceae TaxID=171552 RepID=A0ABS3M3L3_9BACT|nr:hypothetical protein [Prevotella illustrans]PTL25750.1 hypothetical protein C3V39_00860 [Prevotella sp. oral taxon 820]